MTEERFENLRPAPIGEMIVSATPNDVLIAYGLGSCVAICLYDPVVHVGGILHALLPTPTTESRVNGRPTKYVDRGIVLLLESLFKHSAKRFRLLVYLCGGAKMVTTMGFEDMLNIGERNVIAAHEVLEAHNLRIRAEATGGAAGRTVKLYIATGKVTVRTLRGGEEVLGS
ncbi:MAG TPA: chemotaxis protein CheD [Anaerolineae bacterium]|nr:chemotaxis protein CheD [Anaerolineae bacterium]